MPLDVASSVNGPEPHDVVELLARSELLGRLDPDELLEVARQVEHLVLPARGVLFRQDQPGDSVYFLVSGRLQVVIEGPGGESAVGEIGRGECVGEMSLLTNEPRSATIRAIRDSELLRLTRERFERLLSRNPAVTHHVTRLLALRLREANAPRRPPGGVSVVAVVPAMKDLPRVRDFTHRLARSLSEMGPTVALDAAGADEALGPGAAHAADQGLDAGRVAGWLSGHESASRFMLLLADPEAGPWTRRCIRQADLVLVIGAGTVAPGRVAALLDRGEGHERDARSELVLLHPAGTDRPLGTGAWLGSDHFEAHHHVGEDRPGDVARLARHLAGEAVGVVLGGGGARGFAHIGVLRALAAAGIPIDRIGGASAGAVIAAQYAAGYPLEELVELNRLWGKYRVSGGYTLPIVSLITGGNGQRMLQRLFGDGRLEDLWLPFFSVATNLTRAEPVVARTGRLVQTLGASISVPGIAPPRIGEGGDLFIDGGVMDNVPAGTMLRSARGPVIASDVSPVVELRADPSYRKQPSTLRVLGDYLNPLTRGRRFPTIFQILQRATLLGSVRASRVIRHEVDLYLTPPVSQFEIFAWENVEQLALAGYEYTARELERVLADPGSRLTAASSRRSSAEPPRDAAAALEVSA